MKTTGFLLFALLVAGCGAVTAQEPPVPTQPPVSTPPPPATTAPPATAQEPPPPVQTPAAPAPSAAPAVPPAPERVELTGDEFRRRRNAIFLMEGLFVNSVRLAAADTQQQIEAFQPGLRISMFSAVPPQARGGYIEDYGVLFMVQIPTYIPSVVKVIEDLARNPRPALTNPATPAGIERSAPRAAALDPDAFYVNAVREYLINAMLEQSKSLELRPSEWLTVMARGDDDGGLSQPSTMTLRIKGSDLIDFLAGRLTREAVGKRVEVKGFSGR